MRKSVGALVVTTLACAGPLTSETYPLLATFPAPPIADCPKVELTRVKTMDVAIAIDVSRSTLDPTGRDIDANGKVGRPIISRVGGMFDLGSTDPGDSFLPAQVVAARSVMRGFRPTGIRFGIVSFSSEGQQQAVPSKNLPGLELALERILRQGSHGNTAFAVGIEAALQVLADATPPATRKRQRILFISDSPIPVPSKGYGSGPLHDPAIQKALLRARSSGVVIDTFALGAAGSAQQRFLPMIARATGGAYSSVSDSSILHCYLAQSLAR